VRVVEDFDAGFVDEEGCGAAGGGICAREFANDIV
jgi:hypothetical protein